MLSGMLITQAAPMYLPLQKATIHTQAIRDVPDCSASVTLDQTGKHITEAILIIGDQQHHFPIQALSKIEFPDLSSLKIETEIGRKGEACFSIVLSPARDTQYLTRYHISVVDDTFTQVTKMWDEPVAGYTKRHYETLYKSNE